MSITIKNEIPMRVIFANDGSITINLNGGQYATTTSDPMEAVCRVLGWMAERSTDGWEGNSEAAASICPTFEEIAAGGFRVIGETEIVAVYEQDASGEFEKTIDEMTLEFKAAGWSNVRAFVRDLRRMN